MHELAPIIRDLAVILGIAGFITLLFQKIHQPVVLGYLVAGIIVGPYTPPHSLVNDIPNIKVLAELGVIFLMFSLGLEFSFHKLTRVGFSASITGIFEVIVMTIIGFIMGKMIGWSYYNSLFLGAALAISSTTIIIKALEELNLTKQHFAEMVFAILVVEDLLAILMLVALSTVMIAKNIFSIAMLWSATTLVIVVTTWFIVGYFLVPYAYRKIEKFTNSEVLTIVSVALCLILVVVAAHYHYSSALGAFIMGSILAETPQVHLITELVRPIRDIFAAVFFVSVGMLIDPQMILAHWELVLIISAVMIISKIVISGMGALITGQSPNTAVRIGFSMAQIGEFSFIIAALGIAIGAADNELYAIIVAVSAITTFTTPYLIKLSGRVSERLDSKVSVKTKDQLQNYSTWLYRLLAPKHEGAGYSKAFFRFIINSIIVAVIFVVIKNMFFPYLHATHMLNLTTKLWVWLLAFLLSSPFIWAMLFSFKTTVLQKKSLSLMIFCWLLTIIEVKYLSHAYVPSGLAEIILLISAIIVFSVLFEPLGRLYRWFESRLIYNLSLTEKQSAIKLPFLLKHLGVELPIIQAPMAGGITTAELVAAVSNAGGIGSLGAAYLSPGEMREAIAKIRKLTNKPFAVNLFVPGTSTATQDQIGHARDVVERCCSELKISIDTVSAPFAPNFDDQMQVIIDEKVQIFSFTFGIPGKKWLTQLKNESIITMGTATTLAEAQLLEKSGIDFISAQGSEAGGHRGTFLVPVQDALIPLAQLVAEIVTGVSIPVIAAGGIMNADDMKAALSYGACAVQMGTAFLTCKESGASAVYKNALLNATQDTATVVTKVFSGKYARAIQNKFTVCMKKYENFVLDFPIQNKLTRPMRKASEQQNNPEFMSLWAGVNAYLCREQSVEELMIEFRQIFHR